MTAQSVIVDHLIPVPPVAKPARLLGTGRDLLRRHPRFELPPCASHPLLPVLRIEIRQDPHVGDDDLGNTWSRGDALDVAVERACHGEGCPKDGATGVLLDRDQNSLHGRYTQAGTSEAFY